MEDISDFESLILKKLSCVTGRHLDLFQTRKALVYKAKAFANIHFPFFQFRILNKSVTLSLVCGSRRRYFVNAHAEGHNNIHAKIIFIIDANPVISTIHTLDIFHRTDFIQFIRLHDFVECKCT